MSRRTPHPEAPVEHVAARTEHADTQARHEHRVQLRVMLGGVAVAILYGLLVRFCLSATGQAMDLEDAFVVMTFGFVFGVPFAIGFIAVFVGRVRSFWRALVFPQFPALAALGASLALAWEGLICVLLWLPLVLVLAALGGLVGAVALRLSSPLGRRSSLGVALVLPYGGMLLEHDLATPVELRHVETFIDIAAPPEVVWTEIVEVPEIQGSEHSFALSHLIGFPRPVAALTDGHGVGSVREASFEGGVVFVEKVTRFDEQRALSFSIHADPASIPARSLDEHVTVGGPYFDVLEGSYRIEPRAPGVRLHLSSQHRLSTRFNFYSGFWTDFIMRDTQQYILNIVRRRAERHAQG